MAGSQGLRNIFGIMPLRLQRSLLALLLAFVLTSATLWIRSLNSLSWTNIFYPRQAIGLESHSAPITCYDDTLSNQLEDVSDYPPVSDNAIFFHETSCASALKDGDFVFSPRQACAVESAARADADAEINVLFLSPIRLKNIHDTKNSAVKSVLTYQNVHFKHVNLDRYVKGTPLESWYKTGALKSSLWPTSHASDVMRYLTLWKFSGTYLDLDVVLLKSLKNLKNFAGAESPRALGAGVINLDSTDTGRKMADAFLMELLRTFSGSDWGGNGPGVITRVLERFCHVKKVQDMTPDICGGFTIHPPAAFYPISFQSWHDYFNETNSRATMEKHKDSYAAHVSNKFSINEKIMVGSKQPYGLLAAEFCPKVYASCSSVF